MARSLLPLSGGMIKELRCADVFEGCAHVVQGHHIRTVIAEFMAHVREVHRVSSPTPELRILVMTAVRDVQVRVE